MAVIGSIRCSRWITNNGVGMGSKQQDLGGDALMIFITSSFVTGSNIIIQSPSKQSKEGREEDAASMGFLIFACSMKKLPNLSASLSAGIVLGIEPWLLPPFPDNVFATL